MPENFSDEIINRYSRDLFIDQIEWLTYHGQSANLSDNHIMPPGTTFSRWLAFDLLINEFYQSPQVVSALQKNYPIPRRPNQAYSTNEFSYSSVLSEIFNSTINHYFASSLNEKFITLMKMKVKNVTPDFIFADVKFELGGTLRYPEIAFISASMPIELKRPTVLEVSIFTHLADCYYTEDIPSIRGPVHQLAYYMYETNSKYGVLTTGYQTWVFKRENRSFFVSPTQPQANWLRTLYFACWLAKEEYTASRTGRPDDSSAAFNTQQPRGQGDEPRGQGDESKGQDGRTSDRKRGSGNPTNSESFDAPAGTSCPPIVNYASTVQLPEFEDIDLQITKQVLGEGRSGFVYLGHLRHEGIETPVAVKVCNGEEGIQDEMTNEARVLVYANQRGVQTAPKIYFSGLYQNKFINVVELFDSQKYYQKLMGDWNRKEYDLFCQTVTELKTHHISHRDLRGANVFFSKEKQECRIIDYGYSRILKPPSN